LYALLTAIVLLPARRILQSAKPKRIVIPKRGRATNLLFRCRQEADSSPVNPASE
jgi:hypothetical protein